MNRMKCDQVRKKKLFSSNSNFEIRSQTEKKTQT
jgi:hypothetical protein